MPSTPVAMMAAKAIRKYIGCPLGMDNCCVGDQLCVECANDVPDHAAIKPLVSRQRHGQRRARSGARSWRVARLGYLVVA